MLLTFCSHSRQVEMLLGLGVGGVQGRQAQCAKLPKFFVLQNSTAYWCHVHCASNPPGGHPSCSGAKARVGWMVLIPWYCPGVLDHFYCAVYPSFLQPCHHSMMFSLPSFGMIGTLDSKHWFCVWLYFPFALGVSFGGGDYLPHCPSDSPCAF